MTIPGAQRAWIIDTSSIVEVRRAYRREEQPVVYARLTRLVDQGVLFFPREVLNELRDGAIAGSDLPLDWAEACAERATSQGTVIEEVRTLVLPRVPSVLDHTKVGGADEADPYMLGLALRLVALGRRVTVISQEIRDRPDKMSMSTASGLLDLPCVPIVPLINDLSRLDQ